MISPISSTSCILGSHSGFENGLPSLIASFIAVIAFSLVLNVPIRCSVQYSLPHSSSVRLIYKSYRIFIQLPFLISYCFIASFAFVLQMLRAKPIPLYCRAGVHSRRFFNLNRSLRREQAPALRCNTIISQIGRENKFSAEIFAPVISPLRMQGEGLGFYFCVRRTKIYFGEFLYRLEPTHPYHGIAVDIIKTQFCISPRREPCISSLRKRIQPTADDIHLR